MTKFDFKKFSLLCLILVLAACGKQGAPQYAPAAEAPAPVNTSAPMAKMAADSVAGGVGGAEQSLIEISEPRSSEPQANSAEPRKYIALRHHLQIEAPADQMQTAFDAAVAHCEALNCQMLSANYNKETPYNPPSASLSVRVPPRNVQVFLDGLAKNGDVMQHGRDSEDKTNQVVDADARIKNLTELRDRLRVMLTDKSAKFKDLIEVETQLANTQSELDSFTSMRKALSLETDLVAVNIDFSATQGITEQGFFAPVARAFKNAGSVMMESFGSVITFVMGAIPWLLIGIPLLLLVRKFWQKLRAKFLAKS
jgi:predicted small lipoprotein YifL